MYRARAHLGPALLFGLILFNYFDFPTFLIANIIVDIEPLTVILLGLDSPLHGFFLPLAVGNGLFLVFHSLFVRANEVIIYSLILN